MASMGHYGRRTLTKALAWGQGKCALEFSLKSAFTSFQHGSTETSPGQFASYLDVPHSQCASSSRLMSGSAGERGTTTGAWSAAGRSQGGSFRRQAMQHVLPPNSQVPSIASVNSSKLHYSGVKKGTKLKEVETKASLMKEDNPTSSSKPSGMSAQQDQGSSASTSGKAGEVVGVEGTTEEPSKGPELLHTEETEADAKVPWVVTDKSDRGWLGEVQDWLNSQKMGAGQITLPEVGVARIAGYHNEFFLVLTVRALFEAKSCVWDAEGKLLKRDVLKTWMTAKFARQLPRIEKLFDPVDEIESQWFCTSWQ
eukprot:jgi/Mesen1/3468/ME000195S02621